jgi:ribA/ribD-fused uncharacterized protein
MSNSPIRKFDARHRFLSNFWPVDIKMIVPVPALFGATQELRFPSVEHAYQACKSTDPLWGPRFVDKTMKPGEAKRLGRKANLRGDWEQIKLGVMLHLLRMKFAGAELGALLLATGDRWLEEGNTWGDRFWGTCNDAGENHLGRLLMQVRGELRAGVPASVDAMRRADVLRKINDAWARTPPGTSIGVLLSVWLDGVTEASLHVTPDEELLTELDASIGDCDWFDDATDPRYARPDVEPGGPGDPVAFDF